MRQLKIIAALFLLLLVIPLTFYAFYLDRRLDSFQDSLRHSPPQELESDEDSRSDLYHLAANPTYGQLVYVPAYSHVYHGEGEPYLLTITLSVRNTSVDDAIVVKAVSYYDTKGRKVKSYLDEPVRLPALGTTEIVVDRDDTSGGSGANFLVEWYANAPVTEPIIEAIMIDTGSHQGISFARRGSVIREIAQDTSVGAPEPTNTPEEDSE